MHISSLASARCRNRQVRAVKEEAEKDLEMMAERRDHVDQFDGEIGRSPPGTGRGEVARRRDRGVPL
jgi:hypothetical protein